MDINLTAKNVDYNANGVGYHFGAHFNSSAQVLSFNIDIMAPTDAEGILDLFNKEFKPQIMAAIENDIIAQPIVIKELENSEEPEGENNNE